MNKRKLMIVAAVLLALAGLVWSGLWIAKRYTHSMTNDAFVDSHLINVAPQVPGDVVAIRVQEQSIVKKGQVLARVDPAPYQREADLATAKRGVAQAALQKAEADLKLIEEEVPRRVAIAEAKLAIARHDETKAEEALTMIRQEVDDGVVAARRAVDAARASLQLAEEDFVRYRELYRAQAVPERKFQEATRTRDVAKAEVESAIARLGQAEAARKRIDIAQQQLESRRQGVVEARESVELARLGNLEIEAQRRVVAERRHQVDEAERALALAQLNLDYTHVVAPYDGVIAKKWRHLGDYAHKGEPIFAMYNPELLYVTVYLEETRLAGVRPGCHATLQIEAFRQPFRGRVLWIGSATDAKFSLIPRDVSSGEFTYVVQRVPTRIAIERDDRWNLLKPGLSVTVAIEHGPGDAAWAEEALRREAEISGIQP